MDGQTIRNDSAPHCYQTHVFQFLQRLPRVLIDQSRLPNWKFCVL